MNINNINFELIQEIKKKLSDKINLAEILTDITSMSKETVYRRLRGDSSFTLEEASMICENFDISLDRIIGLKTYNTADIRPSLIPPPYSMESHSDTLDNFLQKIKFLRGDADAKFYCSLNTLPLAFFLQYETLAKINLYRWIYQHQQIGKPLKNILKMSIPQSTVDVERRFVAELRQVNTTYILSRMVFNGFITDVKYFRSIHVISDSDAQKVKEDMIKLLKEMEYAALTGQFNNGAKLSIYLSNINFETAYGYGENGDERISYIKIYGPNILMSTDQDLIESQKNGIDSLIRFSTSISQSGEVQRKEFFDEQLKIIEESF